MEYLSRMDSDAHFPIVFFDGICGLCNRAADFILRHDRRGRLRLATLQSPAAQRLLCDKNLPPGLDSIVLLDGAKTYVRSAAALRIAALIGGAWSLFAIFWIVPRPIRDALYNWVARHRYQWFGRRAACRMPTPEERARFIE